VNSKKGLAIAGWGSVTGIGSYLILRLVSDDTSGPYRPLRLSSRRNRGGKAVVRRLESTRVLTKSPRMADRIEPEDLHGSVANGVGPPDPAPVFISYASSDKAAADAICAALAHAGIGCWIAPRNVIPGVFYADAVVQAINAAQVLTVVLSANWVGSQHVLREVERASAKRRPVVAFRLDTTPLPAGLEYFLSASHWLDASAEPLERAFPGLVDAVHRLLGAAPKAVTGTGQQNNSTVGARGNIGTVRQYQIGNGLLVCHRFDLSLAVIPRLWSL
jgi:hypothetical protein